MTGKLFFGPVSALALLAAAVPALANSGAPGSGSGSVLNILLLGLVAYFLIRMFRRRSGGGQDRPEDRTQDRPGDQTPDGADDRPQPPTRPMDRHEAARQVWTMLGGDSEAPDGGETPAVQAVSAGFDEREFLEGAKLFFSRYQQVADVAELDELRSFLSDDVYREARSAIESGTRQPREVMLLEARLMGMENEGGRTVASVHYEATLGSASGGQPSHLRSVWEFSRDESVHSALWTLDSTTIMDQ
ncbi:MAG: TIM44-like domain-containing protein [Pseudodesulfovibrio sp.]